jgi:hypothetical protein
MSLNTTLILFNFDVFQFSITLTFAFTFGAFESLPQNFGLAQIDSKFKNFGHGDRHDQESTQPTNLK